MDLTKLLSLFDIGEPIRIEPFKQEEDGTDYAVWKVTTEQGLYVLKKAKGHEVSVYSAFFSSIDAGAPRFYKSLPYQDDTYFLMEYIDGEDLRRSDRKSLTAVLDALIHLEDRYWENKEFTQAGFSFEASLAGRTRRGNYLNDPDLEQAYQTYLHLYSTLPRTLCHDDLLPFNVLISGDKATIIDWEYAGILPYPTSLARLIAHGTEAPDAFFYMEDADKEFAIEYYYTHFVKSKGIDYEEYRRTLDYFLLYEYCEWIMLGNKYHNTQSTRFKAYLAKAKEHLSQLT